MPDFLGWVDGLRKRHPKAFPSKVISTFSQEEFRAALKDADAAVIEGFQVGEAELAVAPKLRIVHVFGSDTRVVDEAACARRGIVVRPLHRRVNLQVAEHAFALIMALAKRMAETNKLLSIEKLQARGFPARIYNRKHTANSNWARISGVRSLGTSTLGILGLGSIGRNIAGWANAFGMTVLYHQRSRLPADMEARFGVRYVSLDELMSGSDFVSVNVPLNDSTRGLIGKAQLDRVRPGTILVNVARAEVVDHDALVDALASRRLGGLGMDVHYAEPTPDDEPLLTFDNVILSPHIAIGSRVHGAEDLEELVGNLAAAMR
jgi:phosphoglycerate dehydrogenase-like enzyme